MAVGTRRSGTSTLREPVGTPMPQDQLIDNLNHQTYRNQHQILLYPKHWQPGESSTTAQEPGRGFTHQQLRNWTQQGMTGRIKVLWRS